MVGVAVVVALVIVSVAFAPVLPFWIDAARLDVLVLAAFGGPAALAAGRGVPRAVLATLFLSVAISLQVMCAGIWLSQGPQCGSALSDLSLLLLFIVPFIRSILFNHPAYPVIIVLFSLAFVYAVLSRRTLFVRAAVVVALLLAVAGATAVAAHFAGSVNTRCVDF